MKANKIEALLELRQREDELKQLKKERYDKYVAEIDNEIAELNVELTDIENSVLSDMEKENVKTYQHGATNITSTVRRTLAIVDEPKVMESIISSSPLVKRIMGLSKSDLKKKLEVVTLNKPFAKEVADVLNKVEGITVDGTEVKETKYLTVKTNE